jgi:hypothetical protein
MTRSEQFRKSRAWLKTHSFVITNSLRQKLEAVPREARMAFCYVQNKVLICVDEFEQKFSFIPTSYWKEKLEMTYKSVIAKLRDWNELDVNEDFRWSRDKSGYPMSYSVPPVALRTGTCIVDFERKRIRLPRPMNRATDSVSEYALECLKKLTVAEVLVYPPPEDPAKNEDIRRARIKNHCEHIAGGDFSLAYGRSVKRLYHRVLSMPSEGRCNLTYWCPIAEYDVRTCHPLLMLNLFTNLKERAAYGEMLSGDIYSRIGSDMNTPDRERVKEDFQRVFNVTHKHVEWVKKQYVFLFYLYHFPTFAKDVLFGRSDLARYLQNFEARLMVDQLGAFCRENDLFWIPMHDGFISRMDQGNVITSQAKSLIRDAVGFVPRISCTPIEPPLSICSALHAL